MAPLAFNNVKLHLINRGQKKGIGAIYGLKPIKWHSYLNIWLQTCLQTSLLGIIGIVMLILDSDLVTIVSTFKMNAD